MKEEKNILKAFLLNLFFSAIEFLGGIFTHSVSIMSDSVHDFGDAISIGLSWFFEKKSKTRADETYTYGYLRYSVLGGLISTIILFVGSILVIIGSIKRILSPVEINYNGMILLAVFGTVINFLAAYFTRDGKGINQRSVNLHMLEDVLGWVVVLIGSIIMRFTDISLIDSIMSIGVSLFILVHTIKNLKEILDIFLVKAPNDVDVSELKEAIEKLDGVEEIHHIHIWSMDGVNNYATMHIVTKDNNIKKIKKDVRNILEKFKIKHCILETEDEVCEEVECKIE